VLLLSLLYSQSYVIETEPFVDVAVEVDEIVDGISLEHTFTTAGTTSIVPGSISIILTVILSVTLQNPVYETVTVITSPSERVNPLTVNEFVLVGDPPKATATGVVVLDLLQ
jgi:hypothetical protein